jgi:hypothetical protein
LASQGYLKRLAAGAMGLKPWYTRFESSVSTSLHPHDDVGSVAS